MGSYLQSEKEIEAAEGRNTELMVELTSIRLRHDTELNSMKESYENKIKEEEKLKEQLNKDAIEKNQEIKKQRKVYGEKMNEVRTKLDEARAEETITKGKLIANEITTKELAAKLKLKEKEIIDIKERVDKEENEEVKFWREETEDLRNKLNT